MNAKRQPAGTSIGGQWAPGAASEIDDSLDLDDAFDDTFAIADEPEYDPDIAADGGFDLGLDTPAPRTERNIDLKKGQQAGLHPGDMGVTVSKKSASFILAGTRGLAVIDDAGTRGQEYYLTTLRPSQTGTNSLSTPKAVNEHIGGAWEVVDDEYIGEDDAKWAYNFANMKKSDRDGVFDDYSESARVMFAERADPAAIGALSAMGERQWCQETGSGPEYASHPLARTKAYDFIAATPDVSLRPSPDFGADDPDFVDEWDDIEGLGPGQRSQVFARREPDSRRIEHFYAEGTDIYCHQWPDNTIERIET